MRSRRDGDVNKQIRLHRARTEQRLAAWFQKTKGAASVNAVKQLIFYERPGREFSDYVSDLVALVSPIKGDVDFNELLPLIQDAWNYFPHLRLDGHCPAKFMLEQASGPLPRSSDEGV